LSCRVLLCALSPSTAPSEPKPLFSAEFLADRELNRTGTTPDDLQAALSASERKKNKSESRSRPHSVIKAHHAEEPTAKAAGTVGMQPHSAVVLQQNGQHGGLTRSSDPSDVSSEHAVGARVLLEQQSKEHDVEAGHALARSGSGRGLALPFTPMSVAFRDICYYVPHPEVSAACCCCCCL
jgi:hypothetical protein